MGPGTLTSVEVREQLQRILACPLLNSSALLSRFLEFTVERTLAGDTDELKEIVLGPAVCGRNQKTFDPRLDPVVRVTASRLRDALEKYYSGPGMPDPIRIAYPRGSYAPAFEKQVKPAAADVETLPPASPEASAALPRRNLRWIPYAVALAAVAAAVIIASLPHKGPAVESPPVRFQVPQPKEAPFVNLLQSGPSQISPNGQLIVFESMREPWRYGLWLHSVTSMTTVELRDAAGGRYPFWSPDSQTIAFFQGNLLRRVHVSGGPAVTICEAPNGYGGSWSENGNIVFVPGLERGLSMVPAEGGSPVPITTLDEAAHERAHMWPFFLPGGTDFLYTALAEPADASAVYVTSIRKPSARKRVLNAHSNTAFVPFTGQSAGLLLHAQQDALLAVRFEPGAGKVYGDPIPLEQGVGNYPPFGLTDYSVTPGGALVFRGGMVAPPRELVWLDRSGKRLATRLTPGQYRYPQVSPDGMVNRCNRGGPQER